MIGFMYGTSLIGDALFRDNKAYEKGEGIRWYELNA
jgi:hypothetical protein